MNVGKFSSDLVGVSVVGKDFTFCSSFLSKSLERLMPFMS